MMVCAQTISENYIKNTTYKIPTATSITSPTITQANQNVTYFDGLGRPIQHIAHQQSGTGKDIVTPIEYDGFGRQTKDYLPYIPNAAASLDYKASALTEVFNFPQYLGQNPFSEKQLEASPLNRVLKQAAPGTDWALNSGHEVKFEYQTNTTADAVKLFTVTANWDVFKGLYDIPTSLTPADYVQFQLYKTITKDENWVSGNNNTTEEFKNKEGQVVLKRTYDNSIPHDNYYVYDQYGNLTFVIPPLVNATTTISNTILEDLCYQYKYDYRNRLVEKKLPGKQWEFIIYDKLDRVVATGPAFSPFTDSTLGAVGWMITKYDAFSRPVYTGWYTATVDTTTRLSLQNDQNYLTTANYETKSSSVTIDNIAAFYTNTIAPTSFKLLTVNYYDDYAFPTIPTIPTDVEGQNVLTTTKSLATGSWVRALTTTTATAGETIVTFYDSKARPIRNYITNYLGGYTYTDTNLDFAGVPQYTTTYHKRLASNVELKTTEVFTYSPQGLLLTHTNQVNALPVQLLAENSYDELGQIISENVGNTIAAPLQKINYSYNIRGWLTGINNDLTNNLVLNTSENDLFAFKINYNTVENCINYTGTAVYNGNISETYWRSASDNTQRKYGYKYDNLNRLRESIYQKPGLTAAQTQVTNAYDENISYDKNGNITTLNRKGNGDPQIGATLIDDLTYVYRSNNSNQLLKVTDGPNGNDAQGFIDANKTDDYTYDANGNLRTDANKGITEIIYNHLNLPTKITFGTKGTISYLYTANGEKMQKTVVVLPKAPSTITATTKTDYLTGFQYNTSISSGPGIKVRPPVTVLQFFPTAEGYFDFIKNGYVYNYTDHLGNVRLSYEKDATTGLLKILEESNYYPFGLKHSGYNSNNLQAGYKYKFQGQERQDELGLNWDSFKWRNYDPAIGRFMTVDPLAEKYSKWTSYAFAGNQVVHSNELEGLEPQDDLTNVDHPMDFKIIQKRDDVSEIENYLKPAGFAEHQDLFASAGDFTVGAANAFGSDLLLGAGRNDSSGFADEEAYEDGQDFGDFAALLFGLGEDIIGIAGGTISALAEIPSFGTSTITLVASGELITHGTGVMAVSGYHLMNGHKSDNDDESYESSGDGNNKPTRTERQQAKKQAKTGKAKPSSESVYNEVNPHRTKKNGNRTAKHQRGEATNNRNQGGERGDVRRVKYK